MNKQGLQCREIFYNISKSHFAGCDMRYFEEIKKALNGPKSKEKYIKYVNNKTNQMRC